MELRQEDRGGLPTGSAVVYSRDHRTAHANEAYDAARGNSGDRRRLREVQLLNPHKAATLAVTNHASVGLALRGPMRGVDGVGGVDGKLSLRCWDLIMLGCKHGCGAILVLLELLFTAPGCRVRSTVPHG